MNMYLLGCWFSTSVMGISFVLWACFVILAGRLWVNWLKHLNIYVLCWIAFCFALHWVHPSDDRSVITLLKDLVRRYGLWFLFIGTISSCSSRLINWTIRAFTYAGALTSCWILLQSLDFIPHGELGPGGFHGQPFTAGGMLLISLPLSVSLFVQHKSRIEASPPLTTSNFISIALIGVQVMGLILLGQRAVWLGAVGGGISALIVCWRHMRPLFRAWAIVCPALTAWLAYAFSSKVRDKLSRLLTPTTDAVGVGCRMTLWQKNSSALIGKPWLGIGKALTHRCDTDLLGHCHNIYLQIAVEGGVVGLAMWMGFFVAIFKRAAQSIYAIHLLCSAVALCIEGMFENWWGDSEVFSCLMFLICLAISKQGVLKPTSGLQGSNQTNI